MSRDPRTSTRERNRGGGGGGGGEGGSGGGGGGLERFFSRLFFCETKSRINDDGSGLKNETPLTSVNRERNYGKDNGVVIGNGGVNGGVNGRSKRGGGGENNGAVRVGAGGGGGGSNKENGRKIEMRKHKHTQSSSSTSSQGQKINSASLDKPVPPLPIDVQEGINEKKQNLSYDDGIEITSEITGVDPMNEKNIGGRRGEGEEGEGGERGAVVQVGTVSVGVPPTDLPPPIGNNNNINSPPPVTSNSLITSDQPYSTSSHHEEIYYEDYQLPSPYAPPKKFLLDPLKPHLSGRKCLVLDLDETLVHSSFRYIHQADFVIPVEIESQYHNVYVIKRPGVDEFMKRVGELYEIVVFTASVSKYGDPLLDQLDVHNVVHHRLFRESCYNHNGNYVKNLSQLGRPLKDTIIIDNSPASYIFHPQHALPISSWFSDIHDNELLDIVPFLEDLATDKVHDVSLVLDVNI